MSSTFIYDLATKERKNTTPSFKQYDEGQLISVELTKNGVPFDLTDLKVTAFFTLPNGAVEQVRCETAANKVLVILGGKLLLYTGYVNVDFKIYNNAYTTVTTFSVDYNVESSINGNISTSTGGGVDVTQPSSNASSGEDKQEETDPNKKKYAILVVGGQSNAVGYDESRVNKIFDSHPHPRIKQLGLYEGDNLQIIPLDHCAQNFQNMSKLGIDGEGTKGIHLPLAKRILNHIPEDYDLLVIPVAYGGTGFTTGRGNGTYNEETKTPQDALYSWGKDSAYYLAMRDRIEHVLSLNEANYLIGVVWCQGEMDNAKPAEHTPAFKAMTDAFFAHFNGGQYKDRVKSGTWGPEQWFIYETVQHYMNMAGVRQIWEEYEKWNPNNYVTIPYVGDPNDYTNKIGGAPATGKKEDGSASRTLESHFGNGAFEKVVAPAVYKKMLENNIF